jgi:RNA polymerase sigma factor (sigma-70 family)
VAGREPDDGEQSAIENPQSAIEESAIENPQSEPRVWFDLDLAVMDDEALVVLAKECEYGPARDELIIRYGSQTERLIRWMAQPHGFSHADVEDARQNAVFWMLEAVTKYNTDEIAKPHGCSFRSFVHRVLMARFKDFAKHLRRVERHYDRSADYVVDDAAAGRQTGELTDPASIAEIHELLARLHETLASLDTDNRQLWQMLADGVSLREVASELSISYDAVKRRRRKLLGQLKSRLNASEPDLPSLAADLE